MKIAAAIVAHSKPRQLGALLDCLSNRDLWKPILHIDRKSDIGDFLPAIKDCQITQKRLSVNWGGYSQVDVSLNLLRHALEDESISHIYLLSGQCMPIVTDEEIYRRISALDGAMQTFQQMPTSTKPLTRLTLWSERDLSGPLSYAARISRKLGVKRPLGEIADWPLYGGSNWWVMERRNAKEIMGFCDKNPQIVDRFKHTECIDEVFFQTISKHIGLNMENRSPTQDIWVEGSRNPEIISEANLNLLNPSKYMFARKFDIESGGALPNFRTS
jgi:hypothetical protein